MMRIARTLIAVPVVVLLAACRENQPVSPDDPPGALLVTNVTTGGAFDLDGYAVVAGERTFEMDANAELLFSGLPDGIYPVELRGLAANCSANGGATRSISIEGNRTTNLRFDVACSAPAELSRIRILFARGSPGAAIQSMNA